MFPMGIPQLYGRPTYRTEHTEDGEFLVKEYLSLFGPHTERRKIVRLPKDDEKEWRWIELKRDFVVDFYSFLLIIWWLVIKTGSIAIPIVLTWYIGSSVNNLQSRNGVMSTLILGLIISITILSVMADIWRDLPFLKNKIAMAKSNAHLALKKIIMKNNIKHTSPEQVGSTHVIMLRDQNSPPQ